MLLERTTFVPASAAEVFAFFSRPENLARITPPSLGFVIRELPEGGIREGARIVYRIRVAGLPLTWVTRIARWNPDQAFVDEQLRGPYRRWVHTHTFTERDGGVDMRDRVDYELPFGLVGRLFGGWFVRRQLRAIFDCRETRIREIFLPR
jgi:ligand-binding SRPBCC domain-containing protein